MAPVVSLFLDQIDPTTIKHDAEKKMQLEQSLTDAKLLFQTLALDVTDPQESIRNLKRRIVTKSIQNDQPQQLEVSSYYYYQQMMMIMWQNAMLAVNNDDIFLTHAGKVWRDDGRLADYASGCSHSSMMVPVLLLQATRRQKGGCFMVSLSILAIIIAACVGSLCTCGCSLIIVPFLLPLDRKSVV